MIGAGDRGRTGTIGKDRRILSPVRLPIPPLRQIIYRVSKKSEKNWLRGRGSRLLRKLNSLRSCHARLRAESFTGAFCPLGFSPSMGIFKKIGSEGGARTLDLAVNSRLLHH